MPKYRYIKDSNNNIICISTFAGKAVKGVAKCHPNDSFDEEKGKSLARIRCNIKIAKKRHKKAVEKELAARNALVEAQKVHERAGEYLCDAISENEILEKELEFLLNSIYEK